MYYNPDGNGGMGQFITCYFSFDDIREAAKTHEDVDDFFQYLAEVSRQEIADRGSEYFKGALESFQSTPDLEDCTSETMLSLIGEARETEKENRSDVRQTSVWEQYSKIKSEKAYCSAQ